MEIIGFSLSLLAGLLAVPAVVFSAEIIASVFSSSEKRAPDDRTPEHPFVAVLIPAHNESSGLRRTIADVRAQLLPGDRLLVVADNCSDDTARVAAAAGAEVIERNDLSKIGKGYALDFGFRHLAPSAVDVVIVVDADCRVSFKAIDRLATTCVLTGRPVQALDLMKAPAGSSVNYQVAEFAWRVKNWARPLGLSVFGFPCQLMGTGMAFPKDLISSMNVASSETVEDLKLGLELALSGRPPVFCPSAAVTSEFPRSDKAASVQRQRWEQGHLRMIFSAAPRLIWFGLIRGRLALVAMALDLAVPPLVLLWLLTVGMVVMSAAGFLTGSSATALFISGLSFIGLMISVFLAWLKYGRDVLPPRNFLGLIHFVLAKFALYRRMVGRRNPSQWVRTEREKPITDNESN